MLLWAQGHQPLRLVTDLWRTYLALMGAGSALQLVGLLVTQINRPTGGVLMLVGAGASIYGVVNLIRYVRDAEA